MKASDLGAENRPAYAAWWCAVRFWAVKRSEQDRVDRPIDHARAATAWRITDGFLRAADILDDELRVAPVAKPGSGL